MKCVLHNGKDVESVWHLLNDINNDDFLRHIVTGDKRWIN